jgi:pyruvate formate lyase activating enzyme
LAASEVLVCDVQRFSIHDGPGIRTTVFFKGCPLACRWCHNPEAISFANQPIYSANDCIRCFECVSRCPSQALKAGVNGIETDYDRCTACLTCADLCPAKARKAAADAFTSEQLLALVLRDMDFYGDEGGVTLSGGEPLVHPRFLNSFLKSARDADLHVVVETAGHWSKKKVEPLLLGIDLVMFDIKAIDGEKHKELTGIDNVLILENLRWLLQTGQKTIVRVPLIPSCNNDVENLKQTAQLLHELGLSSVTLLPYHRLGESKLDKFAAPIDSMGIPPLTDDEFEQARQLFESEGIEVLLA